PRQITGRRPADGTTRKILGRKRRPAPKVKGSLSLLGLLSSLSLQKMWLSAFSLAPFSYFPAQRASGLNRSASRHELFFNLHLVS
ncbi:MAG: hypothetical protein WAJ95_02340, partial [Desulfobacterales bacterium]